VSHEDQTPQASSAVAGCSDLVRHRRLFGVDGGSSDADRRQDEGFESKALRNAEPPNAARPATVERAIDGDTVELQELGSSRLIGVDTAETHESRECFGPQASQFTERMLEPGLRVRVLLGQEPQDDHGRDLVYLWLPDGRLFNAMLATRGLAEPLTIPPNDDLAEVFERAARAAAVDAHGLWGGCPATE
jgi:micrococcal nuclease